MDIKGFLEIGVTLGLTVLLAFPLGLYLARVWEGKSTWLDPLLRPVEKLSYAALGVKADKGQDWKAYGGALLGFSFVSFVALYLIQRYQNLLPWNPQHLPGLSGHLAFNNAISFTTNTNWQSYVPEATMSTFTQMAGLTFHNFVSAAAGIAVAAAVARAFIADRKSDLGNFFVDLIRITLYVLLPISIVLALVFVALGAPQSMHAGFSAVTLEGAKQQIPLYPVASQEAIKMFGTNGGGVFNANSAHPFENPSPLTNLIQMIAMNVLGFACVIAFGKVVGVGREARALVIVMLTLVGVGALCIYASESVTPATLAHLGVTGGNFEGKETRFGLAASSVFAAMTTGASCGAVNGMHGSFMPLSGGVALFLMQIGEIAPGGVGSGLYGMIVMALLSVFVAGLMVGRTPEYLGKKVEVREVKAAMLAVLILPFAILSFSAVAAVLPEALKGLGNTGARGLTEVFYAYTSAAANNGSAFAGLTANAPWWDVTLAIGMLLGRFGYVIPVLYIAGALAAKPKLAPTAGTLPAYGGLFVGLLIGVILILGGLQFFPTLALTSILEHFQMISGH